ncbi:hypothetical protein SAMN04488691_11228 [Haloferax larsenii]|uniref:Uncharacterized protein n=2 Tax=Haloferax larsenii TaxID=302484 RepID=A0A1H7UBL1_HALLR|nr:hypothetical protein SAMN04488691_11228 [Haloferax larsenii]
MVFAQDQHHDKCLQYVLNTNGPVYITPCVGKEFQRLSSKVPKELKREVQDHRKNLIRRFNKTKLDLTDLVNIQQNILDTNDRAHRFLFEYYENKKKKKGSVKFREIKNDLSNIAMEIGKDACQSHGGFESLIDPWTKGMKKYPAVEKNLLVHEGDDKDVCLEAHHIATVETEDTELATANPKHFIRQIPGEPVSRKQNILFVTNIAHIEDTSLANYP